MVCVYWGWICRHLQSREIQTRLSSCPCQLSEPRTGRTKQGTKWRWGEQGKSRQQADEVYLSDPTIKSRVWLVRQPETVTLAKGSLIIIIIAGLFISPPCCAGFGAPAPFHSCFFTQPASLYKWCSVPNQSHKKTALPPLLCTTSFLFSLHPHRPKAVRLGCCSPEGMFSLWNFTASHSASRLQAGQPSWFIMLS